MLELLTLMVKEYDSTADKSLTENPVNIIRTAYDMTLKRHHGFLSKQLFKVSSSLRSSTIFIDET
jgi:hypothetical protein